MLRNLALLQEMHQINRILEQIFNLLVIPLRGIAIDLNTRFPRSKFFFRPLFLNEIYMALKMWEPYVCQKLKPLKGDVVFDVGAHIGYYTIYAAKAVGPKGLVVSVEPDPRNFKLLKKNVQHHNLRNVKLMNCALSSFEGTAQFGLSYNPLVSQLVSEKPSSNRKTLKVDVTTIDKMCQGLHIDQIDWLKIDVEDGALDVLKGGTRILRTQENAIIEVPDLVTLAKLKELGFSLQQIAPSDSEIGYYYATRNQTSC